MLHIKGQLINRKRLEGVLKVLQSTSTSYLLLASLDAARAEIDQFGSEIIGTSLELARSMRNGLGKLPHLSLIGEELLGKPGVYGLDPTKITISLKTLKFTGIWVEKWLRNTYDIQVEMSDIFNILLIIGAGNTIKDIDLILKALSRLDEKSLQAEENYYSDQIASVDIILDIPELAISPREAFLADNISIPLQDSIGRISTETIACYPPGIPVICPGERITEQVIDYLSVMQRLGVHMQGCYDSTVQTISVVK